MSSLLATLCALQTRWQQVQLNYCCEQGTKIMCFSVKKNCEMTSLSSPFLHIACILYPLISNVGTSHLPLCKCSHIFHLGSAIFPEELPLPFVSMTHSFTQQVFLLKFTDAPRLEMYNKYSKIHNIVPAPRNIYAVKHDRVP